MTRRRRFAVRASEWLGMDVVVWVILFVTLSVVVLVIEFLGRWLP